MRSLAFVALLLVLPGCERNRDTAGTRADVDTTAPEGRVTVDKMDSAIKSSLKIEGSVSRTENGFLVVEVKVRNTSSKNLPCEWRTVFQDRDGFDLPVAANPWSPVVVNANETMPLTKTAPVVGADKAVFYIRKASPIRK